MQFTQTPKFITIQFSDIFAFFTKKNELYQLLKDNKNPCIAVNTTCNNNDLSSFIITMHQRKKRIEATIKDIIKNFTQELSELIVQLKKSEPGTLEKSIILIKKITPNINIANKENISDEKNIFLLKKIVNNYYRIFTVLNKEKIENFSGILKKNSQSHPIIKELFETYLFLDLFRTLKELEKENFFIPIISYGQTALEKTSTNFFSKSNNIFNETVQKIIKKHDGNVIFFGNKGDKSKIEKTLHEEYGENCLPKGITVYNTKLVDHSAKSNEKINPIFKIQM